MVNRRPRLEIVAPSADPAQAAAIVAALERFMRDTAPRPAASDPSLASGWLRAGRLEALARDPAGADPWFARGPAV